MSKQNNNFKDYNQVLSLDEKYQLEDSEKKKVKSYLEQQVQYLLDKKEKEKEKKKRIKLLEEEFQRKRKSKIQQFQQKIKQSQKIKQNANKEKVSKNKKNLEYVQKVNKKVKDQHNQIVEKGLQKRKQFYSDQTQKWTKSNNRPQTQQNFKKQSKSTTLKQSKLNHSGTEIDTKKSSIQDQVKEIEEKILKAKNNQKIYQKQTVNRLNQKDRHHSQIKQKIRSFSIIEEQRNLQEVYGKHEHIIGAGQKLKGLTSRHLNDRRKLFEQKIKKLHQNIKYLESEKEQKFASLQNKFNKIYEPHHQSRAASKLGSHRQKVLLNNLKLQEQKNKKAEQILKKHTQMTVKNKIYKEKKDQILQAIKKVNPEIDE